jgi:type II secretory pathway pseudopilin PulG
MKSTRNFGFSLLEVVIYTAMVGVIMLGVITLAYVTLDVRGKVRASIILQENYRFALNRATMIVNQAEDITFPLNGATGTELILAMKEPALDPTIINTQDGVVYLQQGLGQPAALTSVEVDVQNFSIERASTTAPMVRIVISGRLRDSHSSYPDLTVTSTAVVRK